MFIESPKEIVSHSYVVCGIVFVGYDVDISCFHDPYNNDIRVMFAWHINIDSLVEMTIH